MSSLILLGFVASIGVVLCLAKIFGKTDLPWKWALAPFLVIFLFFFLLVGLSILLGGLVY